VDNGPHLPLWDRLPVVAYWTLPALVGLPLVIRGLARHAQVRNDLSLASRALRRATTRCRMSGTVSR
jgi:hypothetical protein